MNLFTITIKIYNMLTLNHLGQVLNSELPIIGSLVYFANTPHLKGQWEFIGYQEAGSNFIANFICRIAGSKSYKAGNHMSRSVDAFN